MKKSLIAAAGATLAVAAMPAVAVFAATEGSFVDNITVTVSGGCTLEVSGGTAGSYSDRTFSASIAAGTTETLTGVESGATITPASAMEVQCNVPTPGQAWNITATAANGGALKDGEKTIPSGTAIDGGTSSFAYSINNGSTWLAVPTEANAAITSGTTVSGTPTTFNPIYRVYVAPSQAPGTYTGSVTYTIHLGA